MMGSVCICALPLWNLTTLWSSFGLPWGLLGSWEVLGDPLGVLGRPLVILGGPWWSLGWPFGGPWVSLGVPREVSGVLGEKPGGTENAEGSLGVSGGLLGGPWGDVGRLGWSLGPTHGGANADTSWGLRMCFA